MIRESADTHLRPPAILKQCLTVSSRHPSTTNHRNISREILKQKMTGINVTSSKREHIMGSMHVDSGINLTRKSSQVVDAPREQTNQRGASI
jgi:hypothetical protein